MDEELHPALLPTGMRDILPPHGEAEAALVARILAALARHGYERVEPPLAEYETSLLAGPGAAMAQDTFRLLDPASHRMIGIRADMTPQIARIAGARLGRAARPLRLCYAGQVLRVRGTELRPARQIAQIGAELIGSDRPTADAEILSLAAEALVEAGVDGLSIDLTVPTLLPALLRSLAIEGEQAARLRAAADHKDATALGSLGGAAAPLLLALVRAAGAADPAIEVLRTLSLPEEVRGEIALLTETVRLLRILQPGLMLTIDPLENRGFEYHSGISFTFFARGALSELGRGGRYQANGESSTGFTVYADAILRAVPPPPQPRRIYLPLDLPHGIGASLRAEGWRTVAALDDAEPVAVARRLGCSHIATRDGIEGL